MVKTNAEPSRAAGDEWMGDAIRVFSRLSKQSQTRIMDKLLNDMREQSVEDAQRTPTRRAASRS